MYCNLFDALCSLFRLAPAHPADSHTVISVRSSAPAPESTGQLSVGSALDDSAIPLVHTSQPVTPPVVLGHSPLTQTPKPSSSISQPPMNAPQTAKLDKSKDQDLPVIPQRSQALPVASQQCLPSRNLTQHTRNLSQQSQGRKMGMFHQASDFSLSGAVLIDNNADNATISINSRDEFMEKVLQETILGAAFDSSARDPPPRCHPGTRLAILERCVAFIVNRTGERKMRWVFGAAGVGKSAIMQSIAEFPLASVLLRASIFFFVNGRSDGSKAIVTLAYQLAVQCEPYRQFVKREIARDPSLLQKSMSVQFNSFIVEPFIHHPQLNSADRVLIIIDGLDECNQARIQRELLRLISDFCLTYPSSPIVWMIASRPEHHIVSFFAQAGVEAAYEKEEILVDSNEACEDVERYLRKELRTIHDEFSLHPQAQWPSEQEFWKLAYASGGLFVFAHTVIRYIGDPDIGDPTAQLKEVLQVINAHPLPNVPREEHPMAHLDALYSQILSNVPNKLRVNARKFLMALALDWERFCPDEEANFIVLCNYLGMTCDEAYAALRHLSSVLKIPTHGEVHVQMLRPFHKSFIDYISDFSRSGFSPDIRLDAQQLFDQCAVRILEQAPDGIDAGDLNYDLSVSAIEMTTLARGPGTGDNIRLTWPVDEGSGWDDNKTRLSMYKIAFFKLVEWFAYKKQPFHTVFFIRLLATRVITLPEYVAQNFLSVVFDPCRGHEFLERGLLQKIPIEMINTSDIVYHLALSFCCPTRLNANLSDPWNPSCTHKRFGEWGEGEEHHWKTLFGRLPGDSFRCDFCRQRFDNQLESWKTRLPDYPVSVLFTSAGIAFVEFQLVDPEDGISEWTYWFYHKFEKEERIKLGSIV